MRMDDLALDERDIFVPFAKVDLFSLPFNDPLLSYKTRPRATATFFPFALPRSLS